MWDTLEMIYEISPSIEQEEMIYEALEKREGWSENN